MTRGGTRARPTRTGLLFLGLLVVMFLASMNYGANVGFFFTFLLAGMALAAWPLAHANVAAVELATEAPAEGFAGRPIALELAAEASRPAHELALHNRGEPCSLTTLHARCHPRLALGPLPRGRHRRITVEIHSLYPLGLFHARRSLDLDAEILVFPAPAGHAVPDCAPAPGREGEQGRQSEVDFAGVRPALPGEPPSRIAWKASARSQETLSKAWEGREGSACWLDWDRLPGSDTEARLSQLARWVLECERGGRPYALRLPAATVPPGTGRPHRHRCLEALACHPEAPRG